MENKTERKKKAEILKRLSAHEMSLEDLVRSAVSVDPNPLWDQEKKERQEKEKKKRKKKERKKTM